MEREIMPDYAAEAFYRRIIPPDFFEGSEKSQKEDNPCIVFDQKGAPHLLNIKKGIKVAGGVKNLFNDEVCMIAPATKVVFAFE